MRPQTSVGKASTVEINMETSDNKSVINDDQIDFLRPDPRLFKRRPRKLLSDDGERVLNVWYIPHYSELLAIYKKNNSDEFCIQALRKCVRIMAAFNDIMHFMYANACMNLSIISCTSGDTSTAQFRRKLDFSTWESAGGLDVELNEIQQEMNCLADPCDPEQVIELLELKRSNLFLQYDCAIRFAVRDIFLANSNNEAFKSVNDRMQHVLRHFNTMPVDSYENTYLDLPEPLCSWHKISGNLLPWRTFISK